MIYYCLTLICFWEIFWQSFLSAWGADLPAVSSQLLVPVVNTTKHGYIGTPPKNHTLYCFVQPDVCFVSVSLLSCQKVVIR